MRTTLSTFWFLGLLLSLGGGGIDQSRAAVDVRIGPFEIHQKSHGRSARELISVGQDAEIPAGTTNSEVVVVFGDLDVNGVVEGDLTLVLGNLRLGPEARLMRDLVIVSGDMEAEPGAQFRESRGPRLILPTWVSAGLRDWFTSGLFWARPLPHRPGFSWWVAGTMIALYGLLLLIFPGTIKQSIDSIETQPAMTFLAGVLTVTLVGPLFLLLAVSFVGWPLVPLVAFGLILCLWIGKASICVLTGRRLARESGLAILERPIPALLLGALVLSLFYMVPILGLFAAVFTATIGLGAVVQSAFQNLRAELPAGAAASGASPIAVQPAGVHPQEGGALVEPTYMPRAGFWVRFGASVLDLLLIGALVAALHRDEDRVFLVLWFAYHLIMWWWRGTTIGGIVFGLKIVRLDGHAIGFGVALVRCLAAFFSAMVFFLGFMWAGWNRDKQSWHDIIAGTVIVRMPRGTPLL